jgi:hypothetical protein
MQIPFGGIPARLLRGQIHPGHAFILAIGMLATILVARCGEVEQSSVLTFAALHSVEQFFVVGHAALRVNGDGGSPGAGHARPFRGDCCGFLLSDSFPSQFIRRIFFGDHTALAIFSRDHHEPVVTLELEPADIVAPA